MWGGFCVSNKPLPPATVHYSFPSPPPLPLREAFHHAKPWRCRDVSGPSDTHAYREQREAGEGREGTAGRDRLSLIWPLFTLPLRAPQMNVYEMQRGDLSENWPLPSPFRHKHTSLLQTLLLECLCMWFLAARIQLCPQRLIEPCRTAFTVTRIVSCGCLDNEKAFPNETLLQEGLFGKPNHFCV